MRITILTENYAGGPFLAEHGLSYFIEIDDHKILFDAGHSDIFLKNADQMQINLESEVDLMVLSHGHWDHGNGFLFMPRKKLLTHPAAFIRRYRKRDHGYIGLAYTKEEAESRFVLETSSQPFKISDNLIYLGEVPRLNDFEAKSTPFVYEHDIDDFIPDDSALAAVIDDELVVITGCSHAGICNIVEYARKITGVNRVKAVIGGFHLKGDDRETQKTIDYFKSIEVGELLPSHCTELPALALFHEAFNNKAVKTGMVFEF